MQRLMDVSIVRVQGFLRGALSRSLHIARKNFMLIFLKGFAHTTYKTNDLARLDGCNKHMLRYIFILLIDKYKNKRCIINIYMN